MLNLNFSDQYNDDKHTTHTTDRLVVKCRFLGIELENHGKRDMRITLSFKTRDGESLSFSRITDRNAVFNVEKLIKFCIDRENDDRIYSSASPSDMFDMLIS